MVAAGPTGVNPGVATDPAVGMGAKNGSVLPGRATARVRSRRRPGSRASKAGRARFPADYQVVSPGRRRHPVARDEPGIAGSAAGSIAPAHTPARTAGDSHGSEHAPAASPGPAP